MRFTIFSIFVLILLCTAPIHAPRAGSAGDLDGRTFNVEMTREDGSSAGSDTVRFDSGVFRSDMFPTAEETPYTTHSVPEAIHFEVGPYAGAKGTVEWTGTLREQHVEGEVRCKTKDGASFVLRFDGDERI